MEEKPAIKPFLCVSRKTLQDKRLFADGAFSQIFLADFHLGEFALEKASKNGAKNG